MERRGVIGSLVVAVVVTRKTKAGRDWGLALAVLLTERIFAAAVTAAAGARSRSGASLRTTGGATAFHERRELLATRFVFVSLERDGAPASRDIRHCFLFFFFFLSEKSYRLLKLIVCGGESIEFVCITPRFYSLVLRVRDEYAPLAW